MHKKALKIIAIQRSVKSFLIKNAQEQSLTFDKGQESKIGARPPLKHRARSTLSCIWLLGMIWIQPPYLFIPSNATRSESASVIRATSDMGHNVDIIFHMSWRAAKYRTPANTFMGIWWCNFWLSVIAMKRVISLGGVTSTQQSYLDCVNKRSRVTLIWLTGEPRMSPTEV